MKFGQVFGIKIRTRSQQVCHFTLLVSSLYQVSALALLALRNQLTIKFNHPSVAPQDERLLLVKTWLESDPGAHDLFDVWENANQVRPRAKKIPVNSL
jgi:hypothetical protein